MEESLVSPGRCTWNFVVFKGHLLHREEESYLFQPHPPQDIGRHMLYAVVAWREPYRGAEIHKLDHNVMLKMFCVDRVHD